MLCLVCEKKIPLHRQLAGSPFCSKEHGEQHRARPSHSSKQANSGPLAAKFAYSSPACALLEAKPDATAFHKPIPRFCDVILCRRQLKPRYTIGVPRARVVGWLPSTAPPEAAHAIAVELQSWSRLHLGRNALSPL